MIVVEISEPLASVLADDRIVVPADPPGPCRKCDDRGWVIEGQSWAQPEGEQVECDGCPIDVSSCVGQRIALAWRETCETCGGSGKVDCDKFVMPCGTCGVPDDQVTEENCWRNGTGSRMVVGWTAEVEAVVPIKHQHPVSPNVADYVLPMLDGTAQAWLGGDVRYLDHADWTPGRVALVLRDVHDLVPGVERICSARQRWRCPGDFCDCPTAATVRPFDGVAELSKVLP